MRTPVTDLKPGDVVILHGPEADYEATLIAPIEKTNEGRVRMKFQAGDLKWTTSKIASARLRVVRRAQ